MMKNDYSARPRYQRPSSKKFAQLRRDVLKIVKRDEPKLGWQIKAKAIIFPILYITAYALILWKGNNPWVFYLCYMSLGFLLVFNFLNLIHDAVHGTIFDRRWIDNLYVRFFDLMGANSYMWKERHVKFHHSFPNIMEWDSDIQQSPLVRIFPQSKRMPIHKYQHIIMPFIYPLYLFNWLLVRDFKDFFNKDMIVRKTIKKIPIMEYIKLFLFKAFFLFYMIFLPKIILGVSWGAVLLGFITMMLSASLFSLLVLLSSHASIYSEFPMPDPENTMPTTWFEHQLHVTNDISWDNWFVRFFMASFNYHIAHHLFPTVHHVHYPEVTKLIVKFAHENNMPYRKQTMGGSLLGHWKLLKKNAVTENIFEEVM